MGGGGPGGPGVRAVACGSGGPLNTVIFVTMPTAAAPAKISASAPSPIAPALAAKPTGLTVRPVAAEKTVTSPGGPIAATRPSGQSSRLRTTIADTGCSFRSLKSVVVTATV